MSVTLLRAGLWIVLISFALYVIHETYPNSALAGVASEDVLMKSALVGVATGLAGFVMSLFKRSDPKPAKGRCSICRRPIMRGEIYCREHLRKILEEEHDKSHGPVRRLR